MGKDAGEVLKEVLSFCYLRDVVNREAGIGRALHMRVAATWSEWSEIAGLLCSRGIKLRIRGRVHG